MTSRTFPDGPIKAAPTMTVEQAAERAAQVIEEAAPSLALTRARDDVVQAAVAFAATTEFEDQQLAGERLRDVVYRMQGVGR